VTLATFVHGAPPPETFLSSGGPTPLLSIPASSGLDAGAAPGTLDAGPDLDAMPPAVVANDAGAPAMPPTAPPSGGCAGCATTGGDTGTTAGAIAALVAVAVARLRRRRA
jgi:MYXO-CTERM domain-containing protein